MKSNKSPPLDLETIMPLLISIWRRFHKESGPKEALQTREFRRVVEAVKILVAQHDGKQSLLGTDYFSNRELLGAYMLYHWVIHYQQAMSVMGELPQVPKRVLDVCSGPAPFAFAALRFGASDVIALDKNPLALDLGAEVSGRYGMPLSIRRWDYTKGKSLPVEGKFDLIMLSHSLEELFPSTASGWQDRQLNFMHDLLTLLNPSGHLMIVESSFTAQNRRVLQLRDKLVLAGIAVQAPCMCKVECPALKTMNNPCYAQRDMQKPFLIKEIQRAAEINLSSLKMSYTIYRAPGAAWPHVEPAKNLYRTISPAIEGHRGKRYYLCGREGKKFIESTMKEQPKEAKAFDFLRRGELIQVEHAREQQAALEIMEGTRVSIKAACGKPVNEDMDM